MPVLDRIAPTGSTDATTFTSGGVGGGWARPALLGAAAAVLSLVVVLAPALLTWVGSPDPGQPWTSAAGVGVSLWLLGHGAPLRAGPVTVSLVPLLLLAINAGIAHSCARFAVRHWRTGSALTRLRVRSDVLEGLGSFVGGYALIALTGSLATLGFPLHAHPAVAVLATALVSSAGALSALVRDRGDDLTDLVPLVAPVMAHERWPLLRSTSRVAAEAVGVVLALGLAVTLAVLALGWDRVSAIHGVLDPGGPGGVGLVLAQLALLLNVALWGLAWLAGPGFSVGVGSVISLGGSAPGLMPMVPFLGALPSEGSNPPWLRGLVLLPVLAGAFLAWRLDRAEPFRSWSGAGARCALAAGLAAAAVAGLSAIGTGAVGVARLAHVGPSWVSLTGALLAELLAGAVATAGLLVRHRQGRRSLADSGSGAGDDPS
ncbi:MAG TPA: DUF6350 family protein [Candidatus Lustribacter sp.]|nr:DUF6350 family protein [Candidatus Lustribacter sp.]